MFEAHLYATCGPVYNSCVGVTNIAVSTRFVSYVI